MKSSIFILGSYAPSLRNFRGALIEDFAAQGFQVTAAAPGLSEHVDTMSWLRGFGGVGKSVYLARNSVNPLLDIRCFFQLFFLFRRDRPEIFFGYTIKPIIWGGLAAAAANVPKRVALITGLGYAFTGGARGKRAVVRTVVRYLYSLSLRYCDVVLFQNEDDRECFRQLGLLADSAKTAVVNGSGVDTEHFCSTTFPDGPIVFLLIARLLGDKGIREYVQAARLLRDDWPEVTFRIVGGFDTNPDGLTQEEVRAWCAAEWITWIGEIKDVRPEIAASHVYVLPSYREGTPRTVLEAMSMGRPVITTNAPGCRQTVEEGVNGFLVPVADSMALKVAMEKFLCNRELIVRMGQQSRRIAVEKFDVRKVNEDILSALG